MTGLQEKLLELLCEIDEICRRHNIAYMLFAGTALGAERHHGFIPWDDDADILMTLENYEKFIRVFAKERRPDRQLNALENHTEGYFFTYARYVNTNTTAIQRHTAFGGCDPGVKIDIFCAVPTFDDLEQAENHKQDILAYAEAICRYGVMYPYRDMSFFPKFEEENNRMTAMGREAYIQWRGTQLKQAARPGLFRKAKRYVLFAGVMSNSYLLDAELMEKVKYVPFEHTMLPVSSGNVPFSRQLYGEGWMNIPDNIEKPRHTMLLDVDTPYTAYLDLIKNDESYIEKECIAAQRRAIHLKERSTFRDITVHRQRVLNLVTEQHIMREFQAASDEEKRNRQFMEVLFRPYYKMQLDRVNRFFKLSIPLSQDAFICAMEAAIVMGKYHVASDIFKLVEKEEWICEAYKSLLERQLQTCIAVTEVMYLRKDIAALEKCLSAIEDSLVEQSVTVKLAWLWVRMNKINNNAEYGALCEDIDGLISEYGQVGEAMALKGLCFSKMGRKGDAEDMYRMAAKKVKNAVIFQQLLDGGFEPYDDDKI